MKIILALAGVLIVWSAVDTTPVMAQGRSYAWCAIYSGRSMGGSKSCSFNTFEQCQAQVPRAAPRFRGRSVWMKSVLVLTVAAGAMWAAGTGSAMAQADPYRWCAELGGGGEGSFTNCYFLTLAQCEATVNSLCGFCRHNYFYTGPETVPGTDAVPPSRNEKKRVAPR
jgi:hypothetical protein